jgi:hypothetical protein
MRKSTVKTMPTQGCGEIRRIAVDERLSASLVHIAVCQLAHSVIVVPPGARRLCRFEIEQAPDPAQTA